MPKLHRQLVHELAEHYGIYTKSTDPEPHRHVDLVRRDNLPRLFAEIPCRRILGEFRQVRTERSDWPSLRLSDAAKVIIACLTSH